MILLLKLLSIVFQFVKIFKTIQNCDKQRYVNQIMNAQYNLLYSYLIGYFYQRPSNSGSKVPIQ